MNGLLFAIQFLTRLPVPFAVPVDQEVQRQSFYWHAAVGLLIGALLWLTAWLSQTLWSSPLLAAAIVVLAWVLITGALHLDGLGDSADAWLGGYGDNKKTLAIMKDPTSGPAAIVWIVSVLLLKLAAIGALLQREVLLPLLLTPAMARFASMCLFAATPYVRRNGLGSPLVQNIQQPNLVFQGFGLVLLVLVSCQLSGLVSLLISAALWFYLRHLMLKRIEGTTGDTAGALIELIETIALIGFCVALP